MTPQPRHPGPYICANALGVLAWVSWFIFCMVDILYNKDALTDNVAGVCVLLAIMLGSVMAPVWALHVACTLYQRCLFRPRWIVTALSGGTGAVALGGLLGLAPSPSFSTQISVALTAGLSLCSAGFDILYRVRARCTAAPPAAGREPLVDV